MTILDSGLEVEEEAMILELLCTVFCGGEDTGGFNGVEQCNTELIKVVFIQKFMRCLSYPQIDEPKYFPELEILTFQVAPIQIKSRHKRT